LPTRSALQTPSAIVALSLALLLLVAGWFVFHPKPVTAHSRTPVLRLRGTDVFPPRTESALPFALRDQNHRLITLNTLRGRLFAITFLDSHCTTECPVVGRELALVQRRLGPKFPLDLIFISVNPKDTPASARAFVRESGITGSWHWLMGTRRQLMPVWREYGILVLPSPKDIVHTAALYLVDRNLSVRVADGIPLLPWQLVQSVRALAAGQ
jgi:cytochrome oxidase Cu insertion factor (SCO1/SenC/PrrC family)